MKALGVRLRMMNKCPGALFLRVPARAKRGTHGRSSATSLNLLLSCLYQVLYMGHHCPSSCLSKS